MCPWVGVGVGWTGRGGRGVPHIARAPRGAQVFLVLGTVIHSDVKKLLDVAEVPPGYKHKRGYLV